MEFDHSIKGQMHRFVIRVHRVVTDDVVRQVSALTDQCFSIRPLSYPSPSSVYVIEHDGRPVALAAVTSKPIIPVSDSLYLYNVCTLPSFRSNGLQQILLKWVISDLRGMVDGSSVNLALIVNTQNASAIRLYTRLGFVTVSTITTGTPDGQPNNLMTLRLFSDV